MKKTGRKRINPSKMLLVWVISASLIWLCFFIFFNNSGENFKPVNSIFLNYPPPGTGIVALVVFLVYAGLLIFVNRRFVNQLKGFRQIAANAILAVLFFCIMEISINVYVAGNPPKFRPDPLLLWRMMPGKYCGVSGGIDKNGFRTKPFNFKKGAGEYRIILLGDSTAYGFQVADNQRFGNKLEEKLKERYPEKGIHIINAAVEGYTSTQVKNLYFSKIRPLNPDMLILSINNDSTYDTLSDSARIPGGIILDIQNLLYKSDTYLLLRKNIINLGIKQKYNRQGIQKIMSSLVLRVDYGEAFDNYRNIIEDMQKSRGRVAVVSMPVFEEKEAPETKKHRKIMKKAAEKHGLFVDLYGKWLKFPERKGLFIDWVHPDSRGHGIIAEDIMEKIVESGILDDPCSESAKPGNR